MSCLLRECQFLFRFDRVRHRRHTSFRGAHIPARQKTRTMTGELVTTTLDAITSTTAETKRDTLALNKTEPGSQYNRK